MKRLYITSTLLLIVCLAWLIPFISILRYGTHTVAEPNLFVLYGEVGLFVVITGVAISNLIYAWRRS